jgi:hypothetical protein
MQHISDSSAFKCSCDTIYLPQFIGQRILVWNYEYGILKNIPLYWKKLQKASQFTPVCKIKIKICRNCHLYYSMERILLFDRSGNCWKHFITTNFWINLISAEAFRFSCTLVCFVELKLQLLLPIPALLWHV